MSWRDTLVWYQRFSTVSDRDFFPRYISISQGKNNVKCACVLHFGAVWTTKPRAFQRKICEIAEFRHIAFSVQEIDTVCRCDIANLRCICFMQNGCLNFCLLVVG